MTETFDLETFYRFYDEYQEEDKTTEEKNGRLGSMASLVEEAYNGSQGYLLQQAQIWNQNILFYQGNQHIRYNNTVKNYEIIPETPYNKFIPRPTTNYLFRIAQTMTSMLTRSKPQNNLWANSDRAEDRNRAKLGDGVLDAKWEIDDEPSLHITASKMLLLCGTVYRKDFWDTTGTATVDVSGLTVEAENSKKVKEPNQNVPLGDTNSLMLSPFQVIPDFQYAIDSLDEGQFILEASAHPIPWIHAQYDHKGKGFTGLAKDVKASNKTNILLDYVQRLRVSTSTDSDISSGQLKLENSNILLQAYIHPTKKYKKGLLCVVCDGKVLYVSDSPDTYGQSINWHPYTMCRFEKNPFKHHGISLFEQIVPIQRRINAIDALIILNRMTMASPQWKIPKGCLNPNQYINGAPGLNIHYKPLPGSNGPEKMAGVSLDVSVYKERQDAVEYLHQVAGDNEVLQGQKPAGADSGVALSLLLEQSYSTFSPLIQEWERFIEKGQTKKINLIRRKYKEPREQLISRVRTMAPGTTNTLIDDTFTGEALGDNLNVRTEAGSSIPRSKAVEQMILKELAAGGFLGDLNPDTNPLANREFRRRFGVHDFPTMGSKDVDRAKWENDLLRQKKFDEVQVLPIDNPVIHFMMIESEIRRPEFFEINDEDTILKFMDHGLAHFRDMSPEQYQLAGLNQKQVKQFAQMANPEEEADQSLEMRVTMLEEMAKALQAGPQGMPQMGQNIPADVLGSPANGGSTAPLTPEGSVGI